MNRRFRLCCVVVLPVLLLIGGPGFAQDPAIQGQNLSPDSLIRTVYASVSFDPGKTPDWTFVRSLFHPDASIVLRVSRDSTAIMSVDGFVKDFVDFIERFGADTTGFRERVVRLKPLVMGNIAHVLVLYEASIPTSSRPPQRGVDSFHLVRREGRWWITSLLNEVVTRDQPAPVALRD